MTVSLFALLTELISALSVHPHPECPSGPQVSQDILFCFYRKVPHEYFRLGLSHTITRCARHVSCSLHTWMNNGINCNKVDNKSHCDPSTLIYTHACTQAVAGLTHFVKLILGESDSFLTYTGTVFVLQIPWPASPTRRDECKWAGKDLSVRAKTIHLASGCQQLEPLHSHICFENVFLLLYNEMKTLLLLLK